MTLPKDQVKHDRINLNRLAKRLESILSEKYLFDIDHPRDEWAWAKAQGVAQNINYAKKLLSNVEHDQGLQQGTSASRSSPKYLKNIRKTLDRLDNIVAASIQRLAPDFDLPPSYLSLVPMPEKTIQEPLVTEFSPTNHLIPLESSIPPRYLPSASPQADPTQSLLPSPLGLSPSDPLRSLPSSQSQATASLLSASLQTHEELSNELSRMATQLKRNAQHFSESLAKDKTLLLSASEALEKNYDTMTKERVRLRDHTSKSFGTTWVAFGALIAVSVAWVFMFFVIRMT